MTISTTTRRVILDAAINRSVIHGTLTTPNGDRREFHGWLELNTALEAVLGFRRRSRALCDNRAPMSAPYDGQFSYANRTAAWRVMQYAGATMSTQGDRSPR
jgi:hypothetical protein